MWCALRDFRIGALVHAILRHQVGGRKVKGASVGPFQWMRSVRMLIGRRWAGPPRWGRCKDHERRLSELKAAVVKGNWLRSAPVLSFRHPCTATSSMPGPIWSSSVPEACKMAVFANCYHYGSTDKCRALSAPVYAYADGDISPKVHQQKAHK